MNCRNFFSQFLFLGLMLSSRMGLTAILREIVEPLPEDAYMTLVNTIATFTIGSANSYIVTVTPYTDTECTTAVSGNPYQNYQTTYTADDVGAYAISANSVANSLTLTGTGNAAMSTSDIGTIQSLKIRYFGSSDFCVPVTCTNAPSCSLALSGSAAALGTLTPAKFIFASAPTTGAFGASSGAATICANDSNRQRNLEGSVTYAGLLSTNTYFGFTSSTNYVNIRGQDVITTINSTSTPATPFTSGLTNSVSAASTPMWTGITGSWFTSQNCSLWTTSSTGQGTVANSVNTTINGMLFTATQACSLLRSIYCIQQ